eukprot:643851-Amphidinium_carterae.3
MIAHPKVSELQVEELTKILWNVARALEEKEMISCCAGPTQVSTALKALRERGWAINARGVQHDRVELSWKDTMQQWTKTYQLSLSLVLPPI